MKKKTISLFLALALCLGLTVQTFAASSTFTDVPQNQWYCTWVTKAAQAGWVSGG